MRKPLFGLVLLIAASLHAQSQGMGALTGTVTDESTHALIPEVLVTVTSAHMQGKQVVRTDSTGTYLISQLPPGTYTVLFEKQSYQPLAEKGIALDADRMLRLNVGLRPGTNKAN